MMNKTIGHLIIKNSIINVINTSHLEEIYKYYNIDTYDNSTDEDNIIIDFIKKLNIIRITSYEKSCAIDFNIITDKQISLLDEVLNNEIYLNIDNILISSYRDNIIREFSNRKDVIRYLRGINNDLY